MIPGKEELKSGFETAFGSSGGELSYYFCPGRVCLIGEHLDYNGGHVMPAAISLGIYAVVEERNDSLIKAYSSAFSNPVSFDLCEVQVPDSKDPWGNYVRGVAQYLKNAEFSLKGCNIYYKNTLPAGAGLSSSAAIEVLTAFLMLHQAGQEMDKLELAKLCMDVENNFVGLQCGIMDQFSVALNEADSALVIDCNSLEYEKIPVKFDEYELIIINTNKPRQLTGSAFNQRKTECDLALQQVQESRDIRSLGELEEADISLIRDEVQRKRATHIYEENKRVRKAAKALKDGDLKHFGQLMQQSHQSLKLQYEVTGNELDTIAENAVNIEGCIGARMTGAGFGGCAIALVHREKPPDFRHELGDVYHSQFGVCPSFYEVKVSGGVRTL